MHKLTFWTHHHPLILASKSQIRSHLLKQSGIPFIIQGSDLDEETIKNTHNGKPEQLAQFLAQKKAEQISLNFPEKYVLGSDQIIVFENRIISKVQDISEAKAQLLAFSGKTHNIISAYSLYLNGKEVLTNFDTCTMFVRPYNEAYVDKYLEMVGTDILSSVGCYQYENIGQHLFEKIDGDFTTILGLPIPKLLIDLRKLEVLD